MSDTRIHYSVSDVVFHEYAIDAHYNRKCGDRIVGNIHTHNLSDFK